MKKILRLLLGLSTVSVLTIGFIFHDDLISITKDFLNIKPQQYYGATVDMSQILPESQYYVVNDKGQDLIDIASNLGMNTLRITNITSISSTSVTAFYSHAQWEEVLGKMQKKRMYAVILAEGNSGDAKFHKLRLNDYYIDFIKNFIVSPNICNFSNVLAIDIANEPLLDNDNLEKLQEASQLVKSTCTNAKITIGSWKTDSGKKDSSGNPIYYSHDPREAQKINNIVDIISVHIYGFDKQKSDGTYPDPYTLTVGYLKYLKRYTNKPILIEEFGAGNGSGVTDQNTIGSEAIQKDAYEGVLRAMYDLKNRGVVIGAIAYLLYPRSSAPESWNISKNNGNILLPAAYTFQKYAD